MKKSICKAAILTFGVVIALIAGCGEREVSKSEIKRGRLIAAENIQLKKEIERQNKLLAKRLQTEKISEENVKLHQMNERLKSQVKDLKESKGIKEWEEETQKTIDTLLEDNHKQYEEITKLRKENESLQTEVTKLKNALEIYKKFAPEAQEPTSPQRTE